MNRETSNDSPGQRLSGSENEQFRTQYTSGRLYVWNWKLKTQQKPASLIPSSNRNGIFSMSIDCIYCFGWFVGSRPEAQLLNLALKPTLLSLHSTVQSKNWITESLPRYSLANKSSANTGPRDRSFLQTNAQLLGKRIDKSEIKTCKLYYHRIPFGNYALLWISHKEVFSTKQFDRDRVVPLALSNRYRG